jgi:phosphate transport system permease protein
MGVTQTRRSPVTIAAERLIESLLPLFVLLPLLLIAIFLAFLFSNAFHFFQQVSLREFLFEPNWHPLIQPPRYGIAPLVAGTLLTSAIALLVAVPLGLIAAIVLSEFAPLRVRNVIKPILDVLAGIPSIVYGYFALVFVTPLLQKVFPTIEIFNALSAGIVMGIMIIPLVTSLSEESMASVPTLVKEAALALGATRLETTFKVTIPYALSGIIASFLIATGRAVGETMIVTMAAGATPRITLNPLEGVQTLTAYIVQVSLGETALGTTGYYSLYAVGLVLFVLSFGLSLLGRWVARWKRSE